MNTIIRLPQRLYDVISEEVTHFSTLNLETFLFLFTIKLETKNRRLYLGRTLTVLDSEKEIVRTEVRTHPTEEFCKDFYASLKLTEVFERNIRLAAIHSHPFSAGSVRLSQIDTDSFKSDRKAFKQTFDGVEFLGIVFNKDTSAFDGVVIEGNGFQPIDEVQIVGKTFQRLWRDS
jgi:hypothetical protein